MTGLIRAELLKLCTTKVTLGLATAMFALVGVLTLVHGLVLKASGANFQDEMHVFGWGELGVLFAALFGSMSITDELRTGTIRPTFLATPQRSRVITTKLVVDAAAGAIYGGAAEALALGLGSAILSARGLPIRLDSADYTHLFLGGMLGAALWGPLGLGLGALVRSQVVTLVGLSAWLFFVENVLMGSLPSVVRFFPGTAAAAIASRSTLIGQTPIDPPLLAPAFAALLLFAYAAAAIVAGIVATDRRDVP